MYFATDLRDHSSLMVWGGGGWRVYKIDYQLGAYERGNRVTLQSFRGIGLILSWNNQNPPKLSQESL